MAKEKFVAVKATQLQYNALNNVTRYMIGDIIYVPKKSPIGDTPAAVRQQELQIKTGEFISPVRYVGAILRRSGRQDMPIAVSTLALVGKSEVFVESSAKVTKSPRTGALYCDTRALTRVSQIGTALIYEGQFVVLKVIDLVEGYTTLGTFSQLWNKTPAGKWANKPSIKEGDLLKLTPTRVPVFEVVDNMSITIAEEAEMLNKVKSLFVSSK